MYQVAGILIDAIENASVSREEAVRLVASNIRPQVWARYPLPIVAGGGYRISDSSAAEARERFDANVTRLAVEEAEKYVAERYGASR